MVVAAAPEGVAVPEALAALAVLEGLSSQGADAAEADLEGLAALVEPEDVSTPVEDAA
jgi:hypothetical protein